MKRRELEPSRVSGEIQVLLMAVEGLAYVAGSAASTVFPGSVEPADIDLFLYRRENFHAVEQRLVECGYTLDITLQGDTIQYTNGSKWPVQLVTRVGGDIEEVLSGFLLSVEQFAIEYTNGQFYTVFGNDSLQDLKDRCLRIVTVHNPIIAAWRLNKYGKKGFTITQPQCLDLFNVWDNNPDEHDRYYEEALGGY